VNSLQLFMPCAAGVEGLLADEVHQLTGLTGNDLLTGRGGVMANASWRDALRLNLHSRLTQRVLIQLSQTFYRNEKDLYDAAFAVAWEIWFTTKQTFKIEITAQHSPLTSLNFAALKIKDAVADRFRDKRGERPDVNTQWPDVRIYVHLTTDSCTLYMDTSGEPLFKRGWREDKGDAPLKETLAAAMLAASGWDAHTPLYDPCCGSGTIAIEAAQIACGIAPGILRRFGFEKLLPFQPHVWSTSPLQKFTPLMWLSAWLTSRSATQSALALAKWYKRAVVMHFSACHRAKHPASCCSTRRTASALLQRV
jgi:putative N6-adenine-specific DNA methylase